MSTLYNPDTYCWYAFSAYDSNHKWCCCIGTGNLQNFQQLNQDNEILQLRSDLQNGVKNPACQLCWAVENTGGFSNRQTSLQWINDTMPQGNYYDPKLRALWLDSGTVCNLACRTCNAQWSSSLYKELKDRRGPQNLPIIQKTDLPYLLQEDYKDIYLIHVIGGEPFLNLDHVAVLEKIVADGHAKQCKVTYLTNGTMPIPQRILKIIPEFRSVNFMVSIDGVGSCFEYTRTGANWQNFEKNVSLMKSILPSNSLIFFHITISALNILYLTDILTWVGNQIGDSNMLPQDKVNNLIDAFHLDMYSIHNPAWYGFSIFTDNQRQKIIKSLEHTGFKIDHVLASLKTAVHRPENTAKFWEEVDWTAQYRQMSLKQYLPKLYEFLQSL